MTIMDREDDLLINNKKKKSKKKVKNEKTTSILEDRKKESDLEKNIPQKRKKRKVLGYKILSFLLVVLTVITLFHIFIEEIFNFFILLPIVFLSILFVFSITFILNKRNLRVWVKNLFSCICVCMMIFELLMLFFGTKTLKFLASITDTGYRVETFGVYVLKDSNYTSLSELDGKKISYLSHDDDKNIKEALKKIHKDIDFEEGSKRNANELVLELINNRADAILMDTSYEVLLEEDQSEKYQKIKMIDSIDIVDIVNTIKSDVDITKNPFVIYVSGIDTTGNVSSKARSDVNMLVAINPSTKNILLINTPRDYYITLKGKGKKDKLTHAGLYGVEESVNSLSSFYETDIDYYVRINFTSFVKIVDELGGINVNVPIKFCEQDSKRSHAYKDLICLNKGVQNLNGEQALALARHRKTLATGDRGRGENQMLVLEAVINKAMSPKIVSKYSNLIDALKGRISTNMTSNEILKFAKKQMTDIDSWKFSSISATGTDSTGVCYATGAGKAYVMEPDNKSVSKIKDALLRLFASEEDIIVD